MSCSTSQDDKDFGAWPEGIEVPKDPNEIAAEVMVRRVLAASPGLKQFARRDGVVIAVEVPSAIWVNPVAEAWRRQIRETEDVPVDGDDLFDLRPGNPNEWVEFRREEPPRGRRPDKDGAAVGAALAAGKAVYGFAPDPRQDLPPALVRAADRHVVVPRPDTAAISEIICMLTGHELSVPVPPHLPRGFDVQDLWLARRPGEGATECLDRLVNLAADRQEPPGLVLDHLAGMDEAVAWGRALAKDLAEFDDGNLPWSAVDRGALLYGPPGTGKTTYARALAGTCGVPLIAASLNRWQAAGTGHLGDLLKAMADSFSAARAVAPAILFIDEIDGFGDRASFNSPYRDYSVQVVNALLEHLDGISGREGVVVVAACNDPSRLDTAILRSGRLDRAIGIPLPDRDALARIFRHHLDGDLAGEDMGRASTMSLGSTGADIERWVRGARRRARHASREMTMDDLLAEIRGSSTTTPRDWLHRYAVHEAGHALAILLHEPECLLSVSIRQTPRTNGGVMTAGERDRPVTREAVTQRLIRHLAGRAAEDVVLGSVSAGSGGNADSDLARATTLATASLTAYALEGSLIWQGFPGSEALGSVLSLRPQISAQVSAILDDAYDAAKELVLANRPLHEKIVEQLLEQETLDGDEVRALLSAGPTC